MRHIFFILLCTLLLTNCGEKEHQDLFDYSAPVDLSAILSAYDRYQNNDSDNRDSTSTSMIIGDLPEDGYYLFGDTSFVLRLPEYGKSQQPFLANAEDFYNSCALAWNIWSNYEIWFRGHTANILLDDDDVSQAIRGINVKIIKDPDVRNAAHNYKDSLLQLMSSSHEAWAEDNGSLDIMMAFSEVIESKAYKFYDDEDTFVNSLDSVTGIAESMAVDKFQHYLEANNDDRLKVILGELSTCQTFDEQCSLWRNWANCEESTIENEWIIAVGKALMESGNYSPLLHRIWITWRALCQETCYGTSRDSSIPNHYYNEYRKKCYVTCLKRIERHPHDVYAMNCAATIGGRTNINRFGQNSFGNEAMIEAAMMLPKRFSFHDENDNEEKETTE